MNCHPDYWGSGLYTVGAIANLFPAETDTGQVQSQAASLICKAMGAQLCCILSLTEDRKEFVTQVLWCEDTLIPVDLTYSASVRGLLGQVARQREIQRTEVGERSRFLKDLRKCSKKPVGVALLAPIWTDTAVWGLILVARVEGQDGFSPEDTTLFQTLVSVLSLGLCCASMRREVKSLSERMSRVDAQLLQSAKLVATGKLAASIAHEINNPLQSVQSCIYLVADAVGPEGPNRQYLDIAREELDRIAKIVQRLIDFYRPSQEGQKPTNLNDLLENVLALMSKRLQQGNVKIVRSLASDLPPATVVADQIKQVFFNLMLNALEAMPQGGQVTVSSRPVRRAGGAGLEIVFKDTGTGIASEILGRIFDPFYTTKVKGTGLGLSISHDIVERHGGSIRVETQVGSGSVFTVYLPVSHEKIEKAAQ